MLNLKETAVTIGDLVARCHNSRSEFLRAAEALVGDAFVREVLLDVAHQRAQIGLELKAVVKCLGSVPDSPPTTESGFQIVVEESVEKTPGEGSERTILRACTLEEQRLIGAFESALEQSLPLSVEAIVRIQLARIEEARDRIRSLAAMMPETGSL